MTSNRPVSLIVLTWNGKKLLEECFLSVVVAAERYPGEAEIIVVDNGSEDGSVEYLRDNYPNVSLIPLHTNTGFQNGINIGVRSAKHDLIFILNNDISLDLDSVAPLAARFTNEKIFAAGPMMRFPGTDLVQYNCSGPRFTRGLFVEDWACPGGVDQCGRAGPTLYVSGGAMMFQRHIFEKMGLFDLLYDPFNCEDIDMSYRAWKSGYYVLYEPASIVYHKHAATIPNAFSKRYYEFINRRHKFLFMWRNLTDRTFLVRHLLYLLPRLAMRTLKGDSLELLGLLGALRRVRQVAERRQVEKENYVRSDAEIFRMLSIENLISSDPKFELNENGLTFLQDNT